MKRPSFSSGDVVALDGRKATLERLVSAGKSLVTFHDNGFQATVRTDRLEAADQVRTTAPSKDSLTDAQKREAQRRLEILKPILTTSGPEIRVIQEQARQHDLSVRTIKRWLRDWRNTERMSALAPKRPQKKKARLDHKVEKIIREVVENYYLTRQKRTIKETATEIHRRLYNADLPRPHENTIRDRVKGIEARRKTASRQGKKAARQAHDPKPGQTPVGDGPMDFVQVDHTKMDVMVVDDVHRRPLGRPWLTVAIDTFSRMVAGFYISLDAPSAVSVGMCIQHAMATKDKDLTNFNTDLEWPIWGPIGKIQTDNAKEFQSNALSEACAEYNITLEYRPVAQPSFGGIVERFIGRAMHQIHNIPGTTFSNIRQKGDYDSEGNSQMTLDELRHYMTLWVAGVYHQTPHSALDGLTPLQKLNQAILGTETKVGIGLLPKIQDEERVRIDFLPHFERTIQRDGVTIDRITYWDIRLSEYIRRDPSGRSQKFRFKRDPRDISCIYFLPPDETQYIPVSYRNTAHPSISNWDAERALKRAKRQVNGTISEELLFQAYNELRQIEEESGKKTKKTRRDQQRRRDHRRQARKTAAAAGEREPVVRNEAEQTNSETTKKSRLKVAVDNTASNERSGRAQCDEVSGESASDEDEKVEIDLERLKNQIGDWQ